MPKGRIKKVLIFALAITAVVASAAAGASAYFSRQKEEKAELAVPILMYHSVSSDASMAGKYTVTKDEFDSDMEYLKANGYSTIFISQLVDYVKNGKALPNKPVAVTLDDGYEDNLKNVLPILQKLGMKATVSIVGIYSYGQNESRYHMDWNDVKTLADSGLVEIGDHTYDMHYNQKGKRHGCRRMPGESAEQYTEALTADLSKNQTMLSDKCGVTPEVFTYPFGQISKESVQVVKDLGFEAALTVKPGINYITGNPEQLYDLHRINRPSGVATEKFMKRIFQK